MEISIDLNNKSSQLSLYHLYEKGAYPILQDQIVTGLFVVYIRILNFSENLVQYLKYQWHVLYNDFEQVINYYPQDHKRCQVQLHH